MGGRRHRELPPKEIGFTTHEAPTPRIDAACWAVTSRVVRTPISPNARDMAPTVTCLSGFFQSTRTSLAQQLTCDKSRRDPRSRTRTQLSSDLPPEGPSGRSGVFARSTSVADQPDGTALQHSTLHDAVCGSGINVVKDASAVKLDAPEEVMNRWNPDEPSQFQRAVKVFIWFRGGSHFPVDQFSGINHSLRSAAASRIGDRPSTWITSGLPTILPE